jgi:thiol:disulfide interchange protein DsbD
MFAMRSLTGLACLTLALTAQAGSVVRTDQVRAELIAHAPEGVQPGKTLWLGLELQHLEHWHTYWKNPGDSGLPTTLSWTLPDGLTAGDIDWPAPGHLPIGPLMNYGYEGTIVLPVPVDVAQPIAGDTLPIRLRADWLVCKVECIPQSGEFELSIRTQRPTVDHAPAFERSLAKRPTDLPEAHASARVVDGALHLELPGLGAGLRHRPAALFPELPGVLDNAARVSQEWRDGALHAVWPLAAQRSASPTHLPLVLVFDDGPRLRVNVSIAGAWPGDAAEPVTSSAVAVEEMPPPPEQLGVIAALLFAFLGGVILNLMPCVFPVLSLKLLSIAQHSASARARWSGALAYTAGVVLSFLALAGLLIAARAAGEQLGWGFQLQSPGIVVALAALFTLIGLNLAGVFELGSFLPSRVASLRARDPTLDSFLTGVLAAAVASPCTAPFMGAALGAALTWPVAQSLAVFAALGLGVAAPYLLVSAVPAVGRRLPRPGRWMQTFKAALAFPMFATVVWLTWVLGQQTGIDGAAALLLALLALSLAAWWWGQRPENPLRRVISSTVIVALAVGAFVWAAPLWRPGAAGEPAGVNVSGLWQPWSPRQVAELRATGRKVFVDFTAAWCVTCQYNKRTTLANTEVLAAFEANKVALLRADWTNRDAAIAAELARLGRSGVPVYVFYDGAGAPRLLSELPSVDEVISAVSSTQ